VKIIGIVLIALGVLMIAYTGFNYVTTEKVVDLGAIKINKEKNHFVQWPPLVGVVVIIGGITLIMVAKRA
jgi:hypothetical protein